MKYLLALFLSSAVYAAPASLTTCQACHGEDGISSVDTTPNLQGQKKTYLYNQLIQFKKGTRKAGIMNGIISGISDKELEELAEYFSKKKCK